jgi:hypothetical protein
LQASALALAGRIEDAKAVARRVLELEPTFSVRRFMDFTGFMKPELKEALAVGLRQAGLPETPIEHQGPGLP